MHKSVSASRTTTISLEPIHPCETTQTRIKRKCGELHRHAEPAEPKTSSASKPNNPSSSFHHATQTRQTIHPRAGPVSKVRLPPPSTTSPLTGASRGTDLAPNRSKDALSSEPLPKSFARAINAAQVRADFRAKRKLGEGEGEDGPKKAKRRKVESGVGEAKIRPGETLAHFNKYVLDSWLVLALSTCRHSFWSPSIAIRSPVYPGRY
jgi:hypothetical protein